MGLFSTGMRQKLSVQVIDSICELYKSGLSFSEVVARTGTSMPSVVRYLKARGVKTRSISEAQTLAKRRRERRELIAESAQRVFTPDQLQRGKERYAAWVEKNRVPDAPPPVNAGFDDDWLEYDWEAIG